MEEQIQAMVKHLQAKEKYVTYLEQTMDKEQAYRDKYNRTRTTYSIFWKHIEVDNLPTSVYITKSKRGNEYIYYFKIEPRYGVSNYIMFEFTNEGTYLPSMSHAFSCYLHTIPNIRFDKYQGQYKRYNPDEIPIRDIIDIEELLLEDSEHIKYVAEYGCCCVCMDNTMTKTSCNHWLCMECEGKIQKKTEDDNDDKSTDEEYEEAKCPICRERLIRCEAYLRL